MCLEDVWMARHSVARYRGLGTSVPTLPANPGRTAIIFSQSYFIIVQDSTGNEIANFRPNVTPQSFTTSVNAVVPPGTETGTITPAVVDYDSAPRIMHIRDYGAVLQQEIRITVAGANPGVWEIEMDPEFEQALLKKEREWR